MATQGSIKLYISNITSKGTETNKDFWKTLRRFLTKKNFLEKSDIMLRDDQVTTKK